MRLRLRAGKHDSWTPYSIPRSLLLAWWDAEQSGLSAGAVSSWKDILNARDLSQGTGSAQPIYSATGFNKRPGVTFDGVDDNLSLTGVTWLPSGSAGSEDWYLMEETALASDASTRNLGSWGSNSGSNARRASGIGSGGIWSPRSNIGDGSAIVSGAGTIDAYGQHVLRYVVTPTQTWIEVDGVASGVKAVVPNTTASPRLRMGADANTAAAAFFQGTINTRIITNPLSDSQAASMRAYLLARTGR